MQPDFFLSEASLIIRALYTSWRFILFLRRRRGGGTCSQAHGKTIRALGVSFIAQQDLLSSVGEIEEPGHRKTGLLPRDPDKLPRGGGIHRQTPRAGEKNRRKSYIVYLYKNSIRDIKIPANETRWIFIRNFNIKYLFFFLMWAIGVRKCRAFIA